MHSMGGLILYDLLSFLSYCLVLWAGEERVERERERERERESVEDVGVLESLGCSQGVLKCSA